MRILLALVAAADRLSAADAKYGKPLTVKEPMPLGDAARARACRRYSFIVLLPLN